MGSRDAVVGIRVKVARCTGCRRTFVHTLAALESAQSSPCNCGSSSVRYVKEARPIGPRSKRWRDECAEVGIDPRTGATPSYLLGCPYFKWKGGKRG